MTDDEMVPAEVVEAAETVLRWVLDTLTAAIAEAVEVGAEETSEELPLMLTVPEAAHLLNISERSVYSLIERGDLDSIKVGRLRRITREAIRRYVDST